MPVTMDDVIRQLDREEPDYAQAARLGPEALPHLHTLIEGPDLGLAVKAASLAGAIDDEESAAVLERAARHPQAVVRVAAAASARGLTRFTPALAATLLEDADPGVRRWALKSVEARQPPGVRARVEQLIREDPEPALREHARRFVDRLD